jgi:serine phosphatase RsbU (regulator of sigma subunit)/predicted negative regulator of RcsB-dependent stress response
MNLGKISQLYVYENYDSSEYYARRVLKLAKEYHFRNPFADAQNTLAVVYMFRGQYDKAIELFYEAAKSFEAIGLKEASYPISINIANIYFQQKKFDRAGKEYRMVLEKMDTIKGRRWMGMVYDGLGAVSIEQDKNHEAIEWFRRSLAMRRQSGDSLGLSQSLTNIGSVYTNLGDTSKAFEYYYQALQIKRMVRDNRGLAEIYLNLARCYDFQNKRDSAVNYFDKAIVQALETGSYQTAEEAFWYRSIFKKKRGDYRGAYLDLVLHKQYSDSVSSRELREKVEELDAVYQAEKKEKEIAMLEHDREINNERIEKQKQLTRVLISLAIVMAGFLFYVLYSNRQRKKANELLANRNQAIEEQKREILSSITYAKRIQATILPASEEISKIIPQHFILYKPKDIVAGDFYWFDRGTDDFLIAVCDCTGHGVPGAMVSVVCHNSLNRAVMEFGLRKPNEILDKVNEIVTRSFSEGGREEVKDGMDISLCRVSRSAEGVMMLEWAGANLPLWIWRSGEWIELKPDKQPIGHFALRHNFVLQNLELQSRDILYLFTDGYADQFGIQDGKEKKLTRKRFREVLGNLGPRIEAQGLELNRYFEEFSAGVEQVDDVLVLGFGVSW